MPHGTLEVLLVGANDLEDTNFFCKMDPYVILTLRTQEKKSTVVEGQGSEPEWNETFQFTVSSDDVTELNLKIMDKDTFSADDFVGEATIPLESVFMEGNIAPSKYNVVNAEKEYHGEITVGLIFTPERTSHRADDCDEYGGSHGGSRRRHGDSTGERYGDDYQGSYGDDSRRNHGDSRERYGHDDSRRGGHGDSRERYVDDDCGGGYGDSRGRSGGRRESSSYEKEEGSYGGYKESSYRD
ncbi:hypothetical protein ABKV19_023184 [Rosa sericea]